MKLNFTFAGNKKLLWSTPIDYIPGYTKDNFTQINFDRIFNLLVRSRVKSGNYKVELFEMDELIYSGEYTLGNNNDIFYMLENTYSDIVNFRCRVLKALGS